MRCLISRYQSPNTANLQPFILHNFHSFLDAIALFLSFPPLRLLLVSTLLFPHSISFSDSSLVPIPTHSPPINVLAKPFPTSAQRIQRSISLTSVFATKAKISTRGISKRVYTRFFSNITFTKNTCMKSTFLSNRSLHLLSFSIFPPRYFPTRGDSINPLFFFFLSPLLSSLSHIISPFSAFHFQG